MERVVPPQIDIATKPDAIVLDDLWKSYADTVAVRGVNLNVGEGEFCTILGPSGSGKTTTLMMIAGFVQPSRGRIVVAGRDITRLQPQKRDLGVVFQNYALFPHMSVAENVAFPLVTRGIPSAEVRDRVRRMLATVELEGFEARTPRQLSGGQQQRVALARALVFEPSVLLMDEPLGALDKKLRASLQFELKHLQRRLKVTVVYVTHDQEEALTMADTVVVMRDGSIEQAGSPEALYERPETVFVADFLGETNLLKGIVTSISGGRATVEHPAGRSFRGPAGQNTGVGAEIVASVRPERARLSENMPDTELANVWPCRINEVTYLGEAVKYHVVVGETRPALAQRLVVKEPAGRARRLNPGEEAFICWDHADTRLLADNG